MSEDARKLNNVSQDSEITIEDTSTNELENEETVVQEQPDEFDSSEVNDDKSEKKFTFKKLLMLILRGLKIFYQECIKFPWYIVTHPIKGWEEFKREKRGKLWCALFFIACLVFLNIVQYQFTGFIVSTKEITDLKTGREIILVIGVVAIVVVSNWSVTTLFDGKGKMLDILKMVGYCLVPVLWAKLIGLIASNFVTVNEVALYKLLIGLGIFLTGYLALFGLITVHEYGLIKCLLSIVGTILAALVICFIGILVFDLFQKMVGFIYTIYQEISLRYL